MSEAEILQFIKTNYGEILTQAALNHRHRPEVMAGIVMRESQGGLSRLLDKPGPGGRGDRDKDGRCHGHGLCQIDDRSFSTFCSSPDWRDPVKNIEMGAWILYRKRAFLAARTLRFGLTNGHLERAAIAAYNAGEGRVLRALERGLDADSVTAHGDYAAEVLRYAEMYGIANSYREAV
jgi:hypothetical protein